MRKIRKVILTMDQNKTYEIIKKLVETNGNKKTAELKIGCTGRHINRLIKGYKEHGKAFFIHGNCGRKPTITIPEDTKNLILDLYLTKYFDCNLTHYSELLEELEGIKVSVSTITSILRAERILSPKANRSSKKALKKELQILKSKSKSKNEIAAIQSSILDLENCHPRQPRCAYFGEVLQMDASVHLWFGDAKTQLHIAVDDGVCQVSCRI